MQHFLIKLAIILIILVSNPVFCQASPNQNTDRLFIEGISENINLYDYEEFLNNIEEIDKKIKSRPQEKDFEKELRKKIDVGIEINNYFDKEKPLPVDLKDCICIALENNFNIKILRERENARKYEYRNSLAKYLPTVGYQADFYRLTGAFLAGGVIPTLINETPFTSIFAVDFPIFQGTNRIFEIKARKRYYCASKKDVEFTKEETLRDTVVSYYRMLGYKLGIEVLTQNLKEAKAQLDINTQNAQTGIGTKFDVIRAEAEVARASQELSQAYNDYRLEQAKLANIMGVEVNTALFPVDDEVKKTTLVKNNLSLCFLTNQAYKNRPDVKSLELKIEALEKEKVKLYSGFLPQLDAYGTFGHVGTMKLGGFGSTRVGLLFSWGLGTNLGFDDYTKIKTYDAQIREAYLNLENHKRNIEQDLISAYYNVKTAEDLIKAAEEEVKAADESLRLAFLRLEAGEGIYIDVLQAQSTKTQANINLIDATIRYNVAQVNLLFNTGTISVFNLLPYEEKINISNNS